jgi:hypothetical protein
VRLGSRRLTAAALLAVVALANAACSTCGFRGIDATRGDLAELPRVWGGHGVTRGPLYVPGPGRCDLIRKDNRLLAIGNDGRGRRAEFVYDTGTSVTTLSACSVLAVSTRRVTGPVVDVGTLAGQDGVIHRLELGEIVCRDLPVVLVEDRHTRGNPRNLLGGVPLTAMTLRHTVDGNRWWLDSPGSDGSTRGMRRVPLLAPGVPMVRLEGPGGRSVYALIDTGAPASHVSTGSGLVGIRDLELRLRDTAGNVVLTLRPRKSLDWDLSVDRFPIECYIGLPDLERATFLLDIDAGVWDFYGEEVAP